MSKSKINLDYLKTLVTELEASLNSADGIKADAAAEKITWMVEMNKATGLAAGIMTEAAMLIGDIQHLLQTSQGTTGKQDFLDKFLGGLKGPGGTN